MFPKCFNLFVKLN